MLTGYREVNLSMMSSATQVEKPATGSLGITLMTAKRNQAIKAFMAAPLYIGLVYAALFMS